MAIKSYNEVYLNEAKRHLGVATDYLASLARPLACTIEDLME